MPLLRLCPVLFAVVISFAGLMPASAQSPSAARIPEAAPHTHLDAGAPSIELEVSGRVDRPARFDAAALRRLPQGERTLRGKVYRGVSLWDLLNTVAGLSTPTTRGEGLRRYVLATAADGYQALFSLAELDPALGAQPVLIATEVDGQPLGTHGMARLIVPNDQKPGRWVSRLARLQVIAAP